MANKHRWVEKSQNKWECRFCGVQHQISYRARLDKQGRVIRGADKVAFSKYRLGRGLWSLDRPECVRNP